MPRSAALLLLLAGCAAPPAFEVRREPGGRHATVRVDGVVVDQPDIDPDGWIEIPAPFEVPTSTPTLVGVCPLQTAFPATPPVPRLRIRVGR